MSVKHTGLKPVQTPGAHSSHPVCDSGACLEMTVLPHPHPDPTIISQYHQLSVLFHHVVPSGCKLNCFVCI